MTTAFTVDDIVNHSLRARAKAALQARLEEERLAKEQKREELWTAMQDFMSDVLLLNEGDMEAARYQWGHFHSTVAGWFFSVEKIDMRVQWKEKVVATIDQSGKTLEIKDDVPYFEMLVGTKWEHIESLADIGANIA